MRRVPPNKLEDAMFAAYVAVTIATAIALSYAVYLSFTGSESVKAVAEIVRVPQSWMILFGTLQGAGAVGLLVGFAVPAIGTAAASGLVLFYLGALGAHLRVRDYHPGRLANAAIFLALAVAALAMGLAYHGAW
jgi:hypothetical protein